MKKIMVAMAAMVVMMVSTVKADNSADVTFFHRAFPANYAKVSLIPGGSRLGFVNAPINAKMNAGFARFVSKDESVVANELTVSGKKGAFDLGLDCTSLKIKGSKSTQINTLGIDAEITKSFAIGTVLPLDNNSKISVGSRFTAKNVTFFVTTTPETKDSSVFGATIALKNVKVDVSLGNGSTGIHLSKAVPTKFGTLKPEIKIQNERAGLTLGFFPK